MTWCFFITDTPSPTGCHPVHLLHCPPKRCFAMVRLLAIALLCCLAAAPARAEESDALGTVHDLSAADTTVELYADTDDVRRGCKALDESNVEVPRDEADYCCTNLSYCCAGKACGPLSAAPGADGQQCGYRFVCHPWRGKHGGKHGGKHHDDDDDEEEDGNRSSCVLQRWFVWRAGWLSVCRQLMRCVVCGQMMMMMTKTTNTTTTTMSITRARTASTATKMTTTAA